IGRLSAFSGLPVTTGYSLLFPVIIVPLFFRSLALLALGVREAIQGREGADRSRTGVGGWLFWAILFLVNAPILPSIVDPMPGQDQVVSESFCVGLSLMF